jgi:hypothetical protein
MGVYACRYVTTACDCASIEGQWLITMFAQYLLLCVNADYSMLYVVMETSTAEHICR